MSKATTVYVSYTNKNQHVDRFNKIQNGLPVKGFNTNYSLILFIIHFPKLIFNLYRVIKKNKITHIYIPMTQVFSGSAVIILKKLTKVKVIFTMHDSGTHDEANKIVKEFLLRLDIFSADAVVFISKHVEKFSLNKYFNSDIPYRIAPFGRLNSSQKNISRTLSEVPNLLFFGRIEKYKGLDLFVGALEELNKEGINFSFTIAGDGLIEPTLNKKIKKLMNKATGILMNSWITDDDLVRLHVNADILVVPYREASQSGVLASAQDFILPFVCTPAGALPEQALKKGGIVSKDFSTKSIKESINLLLNKSVYSNKLNEIYNMQQKKSWKPTADAIIELGIETISDAE